MDLKVEEVHVKHLIIKEGYVMDFEAREGHHPFP
jgi:hypothetical protein